MTDFLRRGGKIKKIVPDFEVIDFSGPNYAIIDDIGPVYPDIQNYLRRL